MSEYENRLKRLEDILKGIVSIRPSSSGAGGGFEIVTKHGRSRVPSTSGTQNPQRSETAGDMDMRGRNLTNVREVKCRELKVSENSVTIGDVRLSFNPETRRLRVLTEKTNETNIGRMDALSDDPTPRLSADLDADGRMIFDVSGVQIIESTLRYDTSFISPFEMRDDGVNPAPAMTLFGSGGFLGSYQPAFPNTGSPSLLFVHRFSNRTKEGSKIHPRVYWSQAASGGIESVVWKLDYTIIEPGGVFSAEATLRLEAAGNGVAKKLVASDFANIAPSAGSDGVDAILIGRISRDSADAGDTLGTSAFFHGLGLARAVDGIATAGIFSK